MTTRDDRSAIGRKAAAVRWGNQPRMTTGPTWKLRQNSLSWSDGCYLHPKCLECPEPQCIYEEPDKEEQDGEIVRLRAEGKTVEETAGLMGMSRQTVEKRLKRLKERVPTIP